MDYAQKSQLVDLLIEADTGLAELGERLPDLEDDEANTRGAYDRVVDAVSAALNILE
jgi:hypothetical protein